MTVGKDVSMLFTDVINCIQTDNIELKKVSPIFAFIRIRSDSMQVAHARSSRRARLQGILNASHPVYSIFDANALTDCCDYRCETACDCYSWSTCT
jgi:hypothetical protein